VQARHGQTFALEGRCPGGEVGAYFAVLLMADVSSFKWTDDLAQLDELARMVGRRRPTARKGLPGADRTTRPSPLTKGS